MKVNSPALARIITLELGHAGDGPALALRHSSGRGGPKEDQGRAGVIAAAGLLIEALAAEPAHLRRER
jgi:hypothetical protein